MEDCFLNLSWLPEAPQNFNDRCRKLPDLEDDKLGEEIRRLASFRLSEGQLTRLSKQIEAAISANRALAPLSSFKLGIISNANIDLAIPALVATAARHRIALRCVSADYGQVMQSALDPNSPINQAECDAVLVCLDHRGVPLRETPGDPEAAAKSLLRTMEAFAKISDGIRRNGKTVCILQTVARPAELLFGSLDFQTPGTIRWLIDQLNRKLAERAVESGDLLLDVAALAETVGLAGWHNPTQWTVARIPFDAKYAPLYADHVGRLVGALRGKSRRVLVLDLDNTLWGGVIGDDGLEGILLGQGDATGEAHLGVQTTALALKSRGVVLAVSSKNDEQIARSAFKEHSEMLLRENDIAVFQANWSDKATNIQAIANETSLGVESFAFLDDNVFERTLVREKLPDVAIPELPEDPAYFVRTLLAAGYFEAITFSDDDRKRADFYRDNAARAALKVGTSDITAYLLSLKMVIEFRPFDQQGLSRVTQLINKSNQFNLTTKRYTEPEVASLIDDPDCFTLQVRLLDDLGDNGMISVIICRAKGRRWLIDTWLMSCRVLGRRVEEAVLSELVISARRSGIDEIEGMYIPTQRNQMVAEHYRLLGFRPLDTKSDGKSHWLLDTSDWPNLDLPMTVKRSGFREIGTAIPA
jgi:FkbH-like protein